MRNITFNLSSLHLHGPAFYDFLALRKRHFVDVLGWDIPHNELVEMDQYDNPTAHYSVVLATSPRMCATSTWPTGGSGNARAS